MSEFLQREGFTVSCEHEGRRGLEKALQPGIDLVVLDVMLPGMDGFEILRRLRQQSKVPVLMLTARGRMRTASSVWNSAPTIICPSPSTRGNWRRASAPSCGATNRAPSAGARGRLEVNGIAIDPGSR